MAGKKLAAPMTQDEYDKMCARMIEIANRGAVPTSYVKTIARAGNVKPVLDYVEKFKKLFTKFTQQNGARGGSGDDE